MIPMLALRFNAEFDQGISGLAVERAVRELVRDGRLRMHGGKVAPNGLIRTMTTAKGRLAEAASAAEQVDRQ